MNREQEKALRKLEDFRDFLKWRAFPMADIGRSEEETSQVQDILLYELHEDYESDDERCSIRRSVKKAFGGYPFERINWDVFGDWFIHVESEKVDFIVDVIGQDAVKEQFDADEVGYPIWVKQCIQKAKEKIQEITEQINSFIEKYGKSDGENGSQE